MCNHSKDLSSVIHAQFQARCLPPRRVRVSGNTNLGQTVVQDSCFLYQRSYLVTFLYIARRLGFMDVD
jgi:hypothetical protein